MTTYALKQSVRRGFLDKINWPFRKNRYKTGAQFVHQLAVLTRADMPLFQAMEVMERQASSVYSDEFRRVITRIKDDIHNGIDLHRALQRHDRYFAPLMIALIRVGIETGRLGYVLGKLDTYLNRQQTYRKKLGSAMLYPGIVLGVAFITVGFLLIFLVPMFSELFAGTGTTLPGFTRMLLSISTAVSSYWWVGIGFVIMLYFMGKYLLTKPAVQRQVYRMLLRVPFIGEAVQLYHLQVYSDILHTLLGNGMPLLDALYVCRDVNRNSYFNRLFSRIIAQVKEGIPLATTLRTVPMIPVEMLELVHIGESSGELEPMLGTIAGQYGDDLESLLDNVGSVLEPVLIVMVGLVVAVILIGMYLPIFELSTGMQF